MAGNADRISHRCLWSMTTVMKNSNADNEPYTGGSKVWNVLCIVGLSFLMLIQILGLIILLPITLRNMLRGWDDGTTGMNIAKTQEKLSRRLDRMSAKPKEKKNEEQPKSDGRGHRVRFFLRVAAIKTWLKKDTTKRKLAVLGITLYIIVVLLLLINELK